MSFQCLSESIVSFELAHTDDLKYEHDTVIPIEEHVVGKTSNGDLKFAIHYEVVFDIKTPVYKFTGVTCNQEHIPEVLGHELAFSVEGSLYKQCINTAR